MIFISVLHRPVPSPADETVVSSDSEEEGMVVLAAVGLEAPAPSSSSSSSSSQDAAAPSSSSGSGVEGGPGGAAAAEKAPELRRQPVTLQFLSQVRLGSMHRMPNIKKTFAGAGNINPVTLKPLKLP